MEVRGGVAGGGGIFISWKKRDPVCKRLFRERTCSPYHSVLSSLGTSIYELFLSPERIAGEGVEGGGWGGMFSTKELDVRSCSSYV